MNKQEINYLLNNYIVVLFIKTTNLFSPLLNFLSLFRKYSLIIWDTSDILRFV
ncbi:UNVERIFIED_ORG: hypothetical protein ABRZ91_002485 [Heyndrickxia coagulans]